MKPTASIALLALGLTSPAPLLADSRNFTIADIPPLPAAESLVAKWGDEQPTTRWYRLTRRTTLSQLATSLGVDVESLAVLNGQPMNHVFESGTWFAVSSDKSAAAANLVSVAAGSVRYSPPVISSPPVASTAKVQRGDSLASFLARHGIKEIELKRLNPGLAVTDISVGRELRVAKAASGQNLLAIRPTTSGGARWPETPNLQDYPRVPERRAEITPERQYVLDRIERERQTEANRKKAAEEARLRKYRTFGSKTYYWAGWKLDSKGTRSTTFTDSYSTSRQHVAVTCKGMRVSTRTYSSWSKWRIPTGDEERMLVELCSQIPGAPKAVVRPETIDQHKSKPCDGSRIRCATVL